MSLHLQAEPLELAVRRPTLLLVRAHPLKTPHLRRLGRISSQNSLWDCSRDQFVGFARSSCRLIANVLLDRSRNAKLSDFRLARLVNHGAELQTTQVEGTLGYIDPKFVKNGRRSTESDVYNFDIVLLEIACGKRPTSRRPDQASAALLASIRGMYHENRIMDAADKRLGDKFDRQQMERQLVTGLWCAHHDPMRRPSVAEAMDVLRCGSAKLPVIAETCDPAEVRALEAQAYGDVPVQNSAALSAETASLLTTGESEHSQCIIS